MSHDHSQGEGTPPTPSPSPSSALLSNVTSLLNATNLTTAGASPACTPEHFTVPLFDSPDPSAPNSFSAKNQQAHVFLGGCLCALLVVWSLFAMDWLAVRRAYRLSACIQLLMGGYLLAWLFVLMYTYDVVALFAYSTSDLLQLQHLSIAALLLAAGAVELCQSASWLVHPQWNVLWSVCMLYVGLVFFAHEQHSYAATVQHISLGVAMVCGALLFGRVKEGLGDELNATSVQRGKRSTTKRALQHSNVTVTTYRNVRLSDSDSDSDDDEPASSAPASRMVDNNLVMAGMCYACAAAILILFRDHSHGAHTGTRTHCQPAWPLTAGGYAVAAAVALAVGLTLALFSSRCVWLSAACCPLDERRNVWLRLVHCLLCLRSHNGDRKRRRDRQAAEEGSRREVEGLSMSAAAQMLAIVRDKEEEERRERERADRRLKEVEQMLQRKSQADLAAIDERWHREDESKEGSSSASNGEQTVYEVSQVEDEDG